MNELTNLKAAVRKYRALRHTHTARWGEGNDWARRARPTAQDWNEYNASNSALVVAHKEVFRAALALGDAAAVEIADEAGTSPGGRTEQL